MSSQAQKRKAKHNFVFNGCDKETNKCKRFHYYGKKSRYENGKRYISKILNELATYD